MFYVDCCIIILLFFKKDLESCVPGFRIIVPWSFLSKLASTDTTTEGLFLKTFRVIS